MSESLKESLSAYIDGEAEPEETSVVLDKIHSDPDLRDNWRNYHLVSAILRGEKISTLDGPHDWEKLADSIEDDFNIAPIRNKHLASRKFFVRSASVLALAACLVLTVFVLIPVDNTGDLPILSEADANDTTTALPASSTNPPENSPPVQTASFVDLPSQLQKEQERRHLQYLIAHDKIVSVSNRSRLPFAKVVTRKASTTSNQ